jgi:hypothetical protein
MPTDKIAFPRKATAYEGISLREQRAASQFVPAMEKLMRKLLRIGSELHDRVEVKEASACSDVFRRQHTGQRPVLYCGTIVAGYSIARCLIAKVRERCPRTCYNTGTRGPE